MSCDFTEHEGLIFAVWGRPVKADFERILRSIRETSERNGKPVIYVSRVPSGEPPPDAEVRRYIAQIMPELLARCSTFHVVLEGDGFFAALKRGVMVSIFQLCKQRGTLFVHAQCDQVSSHIPPEQLPALRTLLQRAKEQGMLDGRPVSLVPSRRARSSTGDHCSPS